MMKEREDRDDRDDMPHHSVYSCILLCTTC